MKEIQLSQLNTFGRDKSCNMQKFIMWAEEAQNNS